MVMPITSTKNFRLSSGFGVSSSIWPRWARSKMGSGVIGNGSLSAQRAGQVVEQIVDSKGVRNETLLRSVADDQLKRWPDVFHAERERIRRDRTGRLFRRLQHPEHIRPSL